MMRRSLSWAIRIRCWNRTVGCGRKFALRYIQQHPQPFGMGTSPYYWGSDDNHRALSHHFLQNFALRSIHSTVTNNVDWQPRRRGRVSNDNDNDGRSDRYSDGKDNAFHNHEMSIGRINDLEQQATDHILNFPIDTTISGKNVPALLAPWHRTTVHLIMTMAKLWGTNAPEIDQSKLYRMVSLANNLLVKVLAARKREVASILNDSDQHHIDKRRRATKTPTNRPKVERLTTEILCQTVTLGWARCDPKVAKDAAFNAQSIFDTLEDICTLGEKAELRGFDLGDVAPKNTKLQNRVMNAWSRSLDPDAAVHGRKLLDRLLFCNGRPFPPPDAISYNTLIKLYAARGDLSAAQALLKEMESSVCKVQPDVYSYSIVMNAFQKRFTSTSREERDMDLPERAEEYLSHLITRYEKSGFQSDRFRPSHVTFGTVLSMWAHVDRMLKEDQRNTTGTVRSWKTKELKSNANKKHVGWGATNAERVLDWFIGLSERERRRKKTSPSVLNADYWSGGRHPEFICPSTRHFVTVMDAWAKAEMGAEGAKRCERLLDRHIALYNKLLYHELQPNPTCYGIVIDAWAKADDEYSSAENAEAHLGRMEELFLTRSTRNKREMLSNIPYNLVIDAWSRRPRDAAERAEKTLRRLISNYQLTGNELLRPDVISYTSVMKAFVDHPNGGEKSLQILEEMESQYISGNSKARPDGKALAIAMDACAKSGLTSEAERIMNDIDDDKKTCVLFNTIMSGYKLEGRGDAAENVLRRMIDLSENGGWDRCRPDKISYSLCVEAWGNSSSPERLSRSRALLDECITRYFDGDERCKPSNVLFNTFANAISNSDSPDKETSVLALFEEMEKIGCEPNLISFNILIKTCADVKGSGDRKTNALQIAASAYNTLPSIGLKADSITYTSMIHLMLSLMDNSPDKVNAIGAIFHGCCEEGYLNQHIMDVLNSAVSEDDMITITGLLSEETRSFSSLPAHWSRNASRAQ